MNTCNNCPGPGWCERHGVQKSAHWVHLCKTNERYWDAWEAGRGPGQLHARRPASGEFIETLNLAYHVCALTSNEVWRANIRSLKKRLHVFSGKRIIAVAQGEGIHGVDEVRRELNDPSLEIHTFENHHVLREVATFLPLLQMLESINPREATFYGHTKGNATKGNDLGVELWRNAMYHHLLDNANACRDLLLTHPCVGTHKMVWERTKKRPFPSGLDVGNWMYAGTFFWFRHKNVFTLPNWSNVPRDRYGVEAWLSTLFPSEAAATVFQPWMVHQFPKESPYDPNIYMFPIREY